MICKQCNKEFIKTGNNQKYCSKECYEQSDTFNKSRKKYRQSDKGRKTTIEYWHYKYSSDPMFKLTMTMRARLKVFLKATNMKKTNKTFKMVGCTPKFLKEYLEKQFKPGMTWQNYSLRGWHVDHKKPISSAKTPEDVKKLMHYTNLQPLWANENLSKYNKLI